MKAYPDGVEVELAKRMSCEELANLGHIPHIRQTHANFALNFFCLLLKYVHTVRSIEIVPRGGPPFLG